MATPFDRKELLAAFDRIGSAAVAAHARIDIAVFGGSALMLASNFRFSTEDVDIAEIERPWPDWLSNVAQRIAEQNGWSEHWLNDAVASFLSPVAQRQNDLVHWGTFPRAADRTGLTVFVPIARHMLALKLKALRISNFEKGTQDLGDVANLLRVLSIKDVEEAIRILTEFFPNSAGAADKARFVLKRVLSMKGPADAPSYPGGSL